jgi:hypothetical protein
MTGLTGVYRIEGRHGEGSFGVTYRARDQADNVLVMVKELRLERLDDWKALELFEREGRVLAGLSQPSIPKFRDLFAHGAPTPLPVGALSTYAGPERLSLVLVQQLIEGSTLQQGVDEGRRLPAQTAERVLRALLAALSYLHSRAPPLVHRDIKPANVILTPEGHPYLVDFGAIQDRLRVTGSAGSTIVGTAGYMPIEQARGDARPASDLYALGVTMIVALAGLPLGELPFDDALGRVDVERALPPGTPLRIRDLLRGLTAPLLGERIQSAEEALAHLDGAERQSSAQRRRRPLLGAPAGVFVVLLAVAGALGMGLWRRPTAGSVPTRTADAVTVAATSDDASTGVLVCDAYLTRLETCTHRMLTSLPAPDVTTEHRMMDSFALMRRNFRRAARTDAGRESLVDTCQTSLKMYDESAGSQCPP